MRQTIQLLTMAVIMVMCIFPPYETTRTTLDAGPEEAEETQVTKYRYFAAEPRWETQKYRYEGHLDSVRLLVQLLLVVALGTGAYVVADD
jgi:hypothetical protein